MHILSVYRYEVHLRPHLTQHLTNVFQGKRHSNFLPREHSLLGIIHLFHCYWYLKRLWISPFEMPLATWRTFKVHKYSAAWAISLQGWLRDKGTVFIFEICKKTFRTIKDEQINWLFPIIYFSSQSHVCEKKIGKARQKRERAARHQLAKKTTKWPQRLLEKCRGFPQWQKACNYLQLLGSPWNTDFCRLPFLWPRPVSKSTKGSKVNENRIWLVLLNPLPPT